MIGLVMFAGGIALGASEHGWKQAVAFVLALCGLALIWDDRRLFQDFRAVRKVVHEKHDMMIDVGDMISINHEARLMDIEHEVREIKKSIPNTEETSHQADGEERPETKTDSPGC